MRSPPDAASALAHIRGTGWRLLKKNGLGQAPEAIDETEAVGKDRDRGGTFLLCALCGHRITHARERIEVNGSHRHTFANPHGFFFEIACFLTAPGCMAESVRTFEATWFPGYSWSIEVCASCLTHLGWEYRSGEHRFHGLLVDRLEEERPSGGAE